MAGQNGGARPGAGRRAGSKSKATVEQELLAERILAEQQQKPGRKLAREVLDDFMHLFMGLAAQHQPLPQGVVEPAGAPARDEAKFMRYATAAGDFAGKLAKYQSPTFKSIAVGVGEFPIGAADQVPGVEPPSSPGAPGSVTKLTPSQAYRLFRDQDLIDMNPEPPAKRKSNKAAGG